MSNRTLTSLIVLAAIFTVQRLAAAEPLVAPLQLDSAGMSTFWQAQLPLGKNDSIREGFLVDDTLYVISMNGTVFSVTAGEGLIRWAEKLAERDYRIHRPTHVQIAQGEGPVLITTTTGVFIRDRFSGELIQRFKTPFPLGSSVISYDRTLLMGSTNGRFYSLRRSPSSTVDPVQIWEVLAGAPVTAAPLLYGRRALLFASQSGRVFSCRSEDKFLHWTFDTDGPILGDPFIDAGGVYVASTDRSLYKLHPGNGRMMWRFRMPRPLTEGPVAVAHTVFQYSDANGISALDTTTGVEKWRSEAGLAFVSHTPNGDFIWTRDRSLQLLDHESGELKHSIDVPGAIATARNISGDAVFLLGEDGRVLCARLSNVPYLRRQQVTAARNQLHLPPVAPGAKKAIVKSSATADPLRNDPLRSRHDIKP